MEEEQIEKLKEFGEKALKSVKQGVEKVETFLKKHKVISGVALGVLAYLLLRKKKSND